MLFVFVGLFLPLQVVGAGLGANLSAFNHKHQAQYLVRVPSMNAVEAFKELSEQTSTEFLFPYDLAESRTTQSVVGRYTVLEALDIMLRNTGLASGLSEKGAITIFLSDSAFDSLEGRESMNSKKNILASTIAFFVGMGGQSVVAQDDVNAKSKGNYSIEEIVVTATKRADGAGLQDTAMAISALTSDDIEKRGLVGMDDYLRTLPGVDMQDRGAGQNNVIIRGVGSDPQLENSTVGVYFGETPVTDLGASSFSGSSGSGDLKLVDIERIEVLRGPQGTLYGSGSIGGTVRILPSSPNLEEFEGEIATRYSQTGEQGGDNTMVQGVINIPLIEDELALRAVAYQFDNSGYIDNVAASQPNAELGVATAIAGTGVARDRSEVGSDDYTGFRLAALWRPVDELSITLGYTNQEIEQKGFPEVNIGLSESYQQVRLGTGPGGARSEFLSNDLDITSLVFEYDLQWGTVTSSSSWIDFNAIGENDVSQFFFAPYYTVFNIDQEVFVEELRFSSNFDGPFQLLAGLYYEDRESENTTPALWSGDVMVSDPTTPLLFNNSQVALEQTAVFAELTYDLTEQLSATVGIRYFDYDQAYDDIDTPTFSNDSSESDQTYKASLSYIPNDDVLIYGQWAQGFRLGQAAAAPPSICDVDNDGLLDDVGFADPGPLGSDNSENFELGIKASLADNRITVNAAVYRIDWEGMPVSITLPSCSSTVRLNAAESKSEGVELEVKTRVTKHLQLDISASYGEATLTEDAENIGAKGDNLPGSADYNISVGMEYGFTLSEHDAFVRGDYAYIGEYYHNVAETGEASGGFGQLNLKTGISVNAFDIDLFVNNATNEDGFTWVESVLEAFGSSRAYRLRPRTIGLNVSYQF